MSAAHIVWIKGGQARVVSMSGEAMVLASTIPSPPGSRLEGRLVAAAPAPVRVKIHGSKLQADGAYRLEGRLLDATREIRARLEALIPLSPP